jgi:hypothetical protein
MHRRAIIGKEDSMIAPAETCSLIQAGLDNQHSRQFILQRILEDVKNNPNQVYKLLT